MPLNLSSLSTFQAGQIFPALSLLGKINQLSQPSFLVILSIFSPSVRTFPCNPSHLVSLDKETCSEGCLEIMTVATRSPILYLLIPPKSSKRNVFLLKSHPNTSQVFQIHQGAQHYNSGALFLQDWPAILIISWSCFLNFSLLYLYFHVFPAARWSWFC